MKTPAVVPQPAKRKKSAVHQAVTSDIEGLIAQLEHRAKPAAIVRSSSSRQRAKPRWMVLLSALLVLASGAGWAAYSATLPPEPEAPRLQPNVTVTLSNAPVQARPRPILPVGGNVQAKSALEQARALIPDDGHGIALKLKPASEYKFRQPESYVVMFTRPPMFDLLEAWKAHGIELVENYGPLVSVYWVASEAALREIGEEPVQVCPLARRATPPRPAVVEASK